MSSAHPRGRELRDVRVRCELELATAAEELNVPARDLRALEWDRPDLLRNERYARKLLKRYERWLQPDDIPRPVRIREEPPAEG
jgi:cytoskeletal protein RodZ